MTPWEDASGGKAVLCEQSLARNCSAEWTYTGPPGRFNIAVQYFDLAGGVARFSFQVNGHTVASWAADASLPSSRPNGDNSTRTAVRAVDLVSGDLLRIEGTPDGLDPAALDYIELTPASNSPRP